MKRIIVFIIVLAFILSYAPKGFAGTEEEIQALKQQVQELLKRIEKLEEEQAKAKAEATKAKEELDKVKEIAKTQPTARVDLANALSKLKIKGRWAAGFFDSGKSGSYSAGSFEVPEAKLQFAFEPDELNKVILRLNLNNAKFNELDYFYLDTQLSKFFNLPFELNSRLGRFKFDFGEETWSNNPVESVLVSNSCANVSGNDEGLQFSGKTFSFGKIKPIAWSVALMNGNDGTSGASTDNSTAKAFVGKLAYNLFDPLYISASYYHSGNLKTADSALSISGLRAKPTGVNKWERRAWEIDLRYDFKKGKVLNPAVFSDSRAILRFAYGGFSDDALQEREGQFGFLEGIYNLNKKFYLAVRYSLVDLEKDTLTTLNGVTANKYIRYSLGGGWRFSENTLLKLGYDWNRNSGPGIEDADDDLFSLVVASQF